MASIGIFCGGYSSEFDISIKSGQTILANFPKEHDAFLVIVKRGVWTVLKDDKEFDFDAWNFTFTDLESPKKIELAIIYIHGNPGENGKMQAYFEMKNIPFINSGALASELSFDKWYCNQFLSGFDIPVAKSVLLRKGNPWNDKEIITELGLPCFVKPADSGSSYGISKVKKLEDLNPALEIAFKEGDSVVIESFLDGIEVTCGVYRKKEGLHALPLTEIASENDFFDYAAKYLGKSQEITPARVSDEITEKVQNCAKKVYELLNLRSISRIDFMLVNNIPYVIEVNTTPGFSPASIIPKMLACEGKSIEEFWREIIEVEISN